MTHQTMHPVVLDVTVADLVAHIFHDLLDRVCLVLALGNPERLSMGCHALMLRRCKRRANPLDAGAPTVPPTWWIMPPNRSGAAW